MNCGKEKNTKTQKRIPKLRKKKKQKKMFSDNENTS